LFARASRSQKNPAIFFTAEARSIAAFCIETQIRELFKKTQEQISPPKLQSHFKEYKGY